MKNNIRNYVFCALCIALCVVLPMAFHAIPNAGQVILPMHIPVLICGLICGWHFGLLCGLAGPLLSSLLTGMPPVALLPSMMVELAVYGAITALMMKLVNTKRLYADLYISLVTAMIIGRIAAGIVKGFILSRGGFTFDMWLTTHFVTALPGIAIQLALIPSLFVALQRAGIIPRKYEGKKAEETNG